MNIARKIAWIGMLLLASDTWAAETDSAIAPDLAGYQSSIKPLMQKYCADCHNADTQEGDVRFDTIDADIVNGESIHLWNDILHRLETGEMPPEGEPSPTEAQRDSLTEWIRRELRKHVVAQVGVPGRVVMRRLSRDEYRNTVRDLLGLPYYIGRELPPDTKYEGFNHVAAVQELSPSQMQAYLESARFAVDRAIVTGPRPLSFQYRSQPEGDKEETQWRVVTHGVSENAAAYEELRSQERQRIPTQPDQWQTTQGLSARVQQFPPTKLLSDHGVWLDSSRAPYNNFGGALRYGLPITPDGNSVIRLRIKAGARQQEGVGKPVMVIHFYKKLLADVAVSNPADDPEWYEFVFSPRDLDLSPYWRSKELFRKTNPNDLVISNGYENPGQKGHKWSVPKEIETLPALLIDEVEMEVEYVETWPPPGHTKILFNSPLQDDHEAYAAAVLERFMCRAFRRPVRKEELARQMKLYQEVFEEEQDTITAIKEALVATLVSPQFLFVLEDVAVNEQERRPLHDYELASRLSYFLWSTMPDDELLRLAEVGQLREEETLTAQIDRMLESPKAGALHRGFVTQWLRLEKLDDLMIDDDRWANSPALKFSMWEEPAQFFGEMLRSDLSLLNLIDSDFAVLNERMAIHYQIPGVYGHEFRKVPLDPKHQRGGLLTQAACMTVTTDGMITSPIYRGVWVLEKILDMPSPPAPADVPPLEDAPEVRLSLREQFTKHREDASCASCHKRIDPMGWPFERYSVLGEYSPRGWGENWTTFHSDKSIKAGELPDLHGLLPSGVRVETVGDLKRVFLDEYRGDVLRSVTKNMLIYALGRPLDISDDPTIDTIIRRVDEKDNSTRELIRAVVFSRAFLEK